MRAKGRDWDGTGHRVPARGGRLALESKADSWDWVSTVRLTETGRRAALLTASLTHHPPTLANGAALRYHHLSTFV
eukprot:5991047-Prymnesium_polylepis.1